MTERVLSDKVYRLMTKTEKKNYTLYIFIALLVTGSFFLGNWYTKRKIDEQGVTLGTKEETQENQPDSENKEIKITDKDPSIGPKDAKVTLVEFSDFLCPFCAAHAGTSKEMVKMMKERDPSWEPAISNIIKDYIDTGKVRLVWKDTPFHTEAIAIHAAGRCAFEQEKFWEFHDHIFSLAGEKKEFSKDDLKGIGKTLKLDSKKFNNCVDSDKYTKAIQEALSYAQEIGVNGTPATFVNDKLVSGAVPYSQFKEMIEEELGKD